VPRELRRIALGALVRADQTATTARFRAAPILESMESLQRQGLRKAAQLVGGREPLGEMLGADADALAAWMDGTQSVPPPVFRVLIDLLADAESVTEV